MSATNRNAEVDQIVERLAEPFDEHEVKWKPAVVSGNRAMALAYVDARVIQDRLDEVLGVQNWKDEYECLPDGSVVCRLSVRLGGEWVVKTDVGGPSEQPDEGDRRKAAFSDALKRAAVKFGIARYIYRLESPWVDYDPSKKRFVKPPQLPAHARKKSGNQSAAKPAPVKQSAKELPANGKELQQRLYDRDKKLAAEKKCRAGDLVKFVVEAGKAAGYDPDLSLWEGPAIAFAGEQAKRFAAGLQPVATAQSNGASRQPGEDD